MNRRKFLKFGLYTAGLGSLGLGAAVWRMVPRAPSETPGDVRTIAAALFNSLDDKTRQVVAFDYDHPLRQYHNRGVWTDGVMVGFQNFSRDQLGLINDLFYAGLSERGRGVVPEQFFMDWPGVLVHDLKILGNPNEGPFQAIISGPHLNLRIGGVNREGVAFGGPQVYGDQHGNEKPGLPGNVYQPQLEAGARLYELLSGAEQKEALLEMSPIQTQIEVQGRTGHFPGLPLGLASYDVIGQARRVIDLMLEQYPDDDVAYAWECIDANGGIEAMSLSYYRDGAYGGSDRSQVFRLEGPAAIFYYRGFPHLHAFVNVAMDADNPLSVGDVLGDNPASLEGGQLKTLFEAAMKTQEQTDFAFCNREGMVGKLRAGTIRTGDIYNAESWQNRVVRIDVMGSQIIGELRTDLEGKGVVLDPRRPYKVATTDHVANDRPELAFESINYQERSALLRDVVIDYLRQSGFS